MIMDHGIMMGMSMKHMFFSVFSPRRHEMGMMVMIMMVVMMRMMMRRMMRRRMMRMRMRLDVL